MNEPGKAKKVVKNFEHMEKKIIAGINNLKTKLLKETGERCITYHEIEPEVEDNQVISIPTVADDKELVKVYNEYL